MKTVEDIKIASSGLRGGIEETLRSDASHFEDENRELMKFHGSYQQDDRDLRMERKKAGLDKAWQFMVRSKIPGGDLTAEQYLMHDRMCDDLGNGAIRLTNRQGIQTHGVLFGSLKECIRRINESGLTTWGACGDIVRNTVAAAVPRQDAVHREVQALAREISRTFYAASHGYSEIWLDAEKISEEPPDPLYKDRYLPRKFKIGIAVPPHNDIDVFTQDAGLVADVENGKILGYTLHVGGSFGMSFGQIATRPALSQPLGYVEKAHVIEALKTVVSVQRDFGRRDDRKQARLKYLILDKGVAWFRERVIERLDAPLLPPKPAVFHSVEDVLGWHEQGDGKYFYGLCIPSGRIRDTETVRSRTALREICRQFTPRLRITANCNLYLYGLNAGARQPLLDLLAQQGLTPAESLTRASRMAHACVALPTCGLALAESERVFGRLMVKIDAILRELDLAEEPILFRMSGCPNGCPRPYNADFAFVGRAPGKYAIYIGGSHRGDSMAGMVEKSVPFDDLTSRVHAVLTAFVNERRPGEAFGDYWRRTQTPGEVPSAEQFHMELAERQTRLATEKTVVAAS
ncbi:MAG: NADPH-dependent assimilatory sulfite reductase hemoprotein subunit [Verrucomicrobiae bacterium]|nr:NADPH-dependent assimilatory sulfite reductase hemoprotein subunit [Verrucomicrobiae bacterium]